VTDFRRPALPGHAVAELFGSGAPDGVSTRPEWPDDAPALAEPGCPYCGRYQGDLGEAAWAPPRRSRRWRHAVRRVRRLLAIVIALGVLGAVMFVGMLLIAPSAAEAPALARTLALAHRGSLPRAAGSGPVHRFARGYRGPQVLLRTRAGLPPAPARRRWRARRVRPPMSRRARGGRSHHRASLLAGLPGAGRTARPPAYTARSRRMAARSASGLPSMARMSASNPGAMRPLRCPSPQA